MPSQIFDQVKNLSLLAGVDIVPILEPNAQKHEQLANKLTQEMLVQFLNQESNDLLNPLEVQNLISNTKPENLIEILSNKIRATSSTFDQDYANFILEYKYKLLEPVYRQHPEQIPTNLHPLFTHYV